MRAAGARLDRLAPRSAAGGMRRVAVTALVHNPGMDNIERELATSSSAIDAAVDRAEALLAQVQERAAELGAELQALLIKLREEGRQLSVLASRWHDLEA